jgi:short-subunit dehydrogenase
LKNDTLLIVKRSAREGFHVALVSRSQEKIESVANELSQSSPISRTLVIAADASNPSSAAVVAKALNSHDVRVLVHNVGVSNAIPTELADMPEVEIARIINVNALFNAQLTRALIPLLNDASASRKARSAILNISSVAVPLQSVYAGTKAFNDTFSRALSAELAPYNIDVLPCSPAYVKSSMSGFKRTSAMVLSPEVLVAAALDNIAYLYTLCAKEQSVNGSVFFEQIWLHLVGKVMIKGVRD